MKFFSRGFTLAEVLVVVSIIGVLASLIAVNVTSSQARARDSRRQADLQNIAGALELYRATNRAYPLEATSTAIDSSVLTTALTANLPLDPHPNPSSWQEYSYVSDPGGSKFSLEARLEKVNDSEETIQASDVFATGIYKDGDNYFYRVSGQ